MTTIEPRLRRPTYPARSRSVHALPPAGVTMSWRGDLLTVVLSVWLIGGIFVDGWAHNTRPQLETFFTPWHALFYSGFIAVATWISWSVWRYRRHGVAWLDAIPTGYGAAIVGLGIFLLSGWGDLMWHQAFGIEQNIAALFSPTHLGLFVGALLVVTAPLRSAWSDPATPIEPSLGRLFPALAALSLGAALTGFINQELHPFKDNLASIGLHRDLVTSFYGSQLVLDRNIEAAIGGYLLVTVLLFGPLLILLRHWRPPAGAMALVIVPQLVLIDGLRGFADPGLMVLGIIGAAVIEVLHRLVRPTPLRLGRMRVFAFVTPVAFWAVYFGGIALADGGLGFKAEIYGGCLVWTGLTGLALSWLIWPGMAGGWALTGGQNHTSIGSGGSSPGQVL